jgi:hypothetical protein
MKRRKWLINDVPHRHGDRGRRTARAAALAIAAIVAAALAACGGGGSSTSAGTTTPGGTPGGTASAPGTTTSSGSGNPFGGSGGAEKGHTVADVLDAVLASGDPNKACSTDYVTEQYLRAAYGDEQGCVQAQKPSSAAKSVDIEGLVGGSGESGTATVKVVAHGGVYAGEKITVSLVKEGDAWKIESLKSNAPVGP